MKAPPGLHLKIAEWMFENGEAVSAYDISENFGITIKQSRAFMTVLEKDGAIKTQRGANVPTSTAYGYEIRTLKVTAIDREKLASRKKNPSYTNYKHHPVESISDLSHAEKWELIISNARRRKR
ncbi:hypothetical protein FPT47_23385 [Salmonella enterica]|nr:hypothetical protein [Salmonella enterica]EAT5388586.1 hypothetical protein [Salmonella enterica]EBG1716073.1 hypothetical protein [Salmonella enterica]ECH4803469.1 hypothetical protein [Salmonella enterica]ECS7629239.1 hypothetical protein [Salmonella enterica]